MRGRTRPSLDRQTHITGLALTATDRLTNTPPWLDPAYARSAREKITGWNGGDTRPTAVQSRFAVVTQALWETRDPVPIIAHYLPDASNDD